MDSAASIEWLQGDVEEVGKYRQASILATNQPNDHPIGRLSTRSLRCGFLLGGAAIRSRCATGIKTLEDLAG